MTVKWKQNEQYHLFERMNSIILFLPFVFVLLIFSIMPIGCLMKDIVITNGVPYVSIGCAS